MYVVSWQPPVTVPITPSSGVPPTPSESTATSPPDIAASVPTESSIPNEETSSETTPNNKSPKRNVNTTSSTSDRVQSTYYGGTTSPTRDSAPYPTPVGPSTLKGNIVVTAQEVGSYTIVALLSTEADVKLLPTATLSVSAFSSHSSPASEPHQTLSLSPTSTVPVENLTMVRSWMMAVVISLGLVLIIILSVTMIIIILLCLLHRRRQKSGKNNWLQIILQGC